jgi:2-keto-3-deoxy-L-rhamnonate aldolase RhmA
MAAVLERRGWKAVASATLLAVAAAMVWPAGAAAVVVRAIAFVAFVAGAVAMLDLIGSRHWAASPSLVESFREIHGFLRQAPNNVLLIIVQDEVEAADAIEAFIAVDHHEQGDLFEVVKRFNRD